MEEQALSAESQTGFWPPCLQAGGRGEEPHIQASVSSAGGGGVGQASCGDQHASCQALGLLGTCSALGWPSAAKPGPLDTRPQGWGLYKTLT